MVGKKVRSPGGLSLSRLSLCFACRIRLESAFQVGADPAGAEDDPDRPHETHQVGLLRASSRGSLPSWARGLGGSLEGVSSLGPSRASILGADSA